MTKILLVFDKIIQVNMKKILRNYEIFSKNSSYLFDRVGHCLATMGQEMSFMQEIKRKRRSLEKR